ncbi:hypothetical protein QA612_17765 [Evansella sp. AB-P1]|uniref:hypothetical protein n=1 Tax=Evansella sp. AB-P1 TaxID=3037653 RepID=UPI00241E7ACF|nr:hypothetical protein [Evansella sp. AB-P1]MDG5789311.1 hypothetical protein [Evansella sp. AB-P1]
MEEYTNDEKNILLAEISYYKKLVDEYVSLNSELNEYYVRPIDMSLWKRILIFFVSYVLIVNIFRIFGLILIVILFYLFFIWPSQNVRGKLKKNMSRIDEIHIKLKNIENKINPELIPDNYINQYALSKLESYLVNKRADTLKEALNLFEQEKRHDEQMNELSIIHQIQESTNRKASEAVTLGWINLFKR